jgi:hypothetical protein
MDESAFIQQRIRLAQVLAVAFFFADLVYLKIVLLWQSQHFSLSAFLILDRLPLPVLRASVGGLSFGCLGLAIYFRRLFLSPDMLDKALTSPKGWLQLPSKEQAARFPDVAPHLVIVGRLIMLATLISSALALAIGIYGLLLFFMGNDALGFYLLLGLSFLIMIVFFPRRSMYDQLLQNYQIRKGT